MSLGFVGFSTVPVPVAPNANGVNVSQQHAHAHAAHAFAVANCVPPQSVSVRQLVAPPAYNVLHSAAAAAAAASSQQHAGVASFGAHLNGADRTAFRLPFVDVDAVFRNEITNAYQTAREDASAISMHYLRNASSSGLGAAPNVNMVTGSAPNAHSQSHGHGNVHGHGHGNSMVLNDNAAGYYGRQSIGVDFGPGSSHMANMNNSMASPLGSSMLAQQSLPLGGRYVCAICNDRATGKHYGVVSCEGCKGFFKRTIRKNLQYACREERHCPIDKRQRNRCQYCRFEKCLATGMKREAVQEERARAKLRATHMLSNSSANSSNSGAAETANCSTPLTPTGTTTNAGNNPNPTTSTNPDLRVLLDEFVGEGDDESQHAARVIVNWAKKVRAFADLPIDDRIALLRAGWNELLIATLAHRNALTIERPRRSNSNASASTSESAPSGSGGNCSGSRESQMAVDGENDVKPDLSEINANKTEEDAVSLSFGGGIRVSRADAHRAGVGHVFDRVVSEIVEKMRQLAIDRVELELIRAVILFNPDARGVTRVSDVERARERVYAALEQYCRQRHAGDDTRFAKLLLRLPALRSVGLKCVEHLFFLRLFSEAPADAAVRELLTFSSSISSALTNTANDADRALLQSA